MKKSSAVAMLQFSIFLNCEAPHPSSNPKGYFTVMLPQVLGPHTTEVGEKEPSAGKGREWAWWWLEEYSRNKLIKKRGKQHYRSGQMQIASACITRGCLSDCVLQNFAHCIETSIGQTP